MMMQRGMQDWNENEAKRNMLAAKEEVKRDQDFQKTFGKRETMLQYLRDEIMAKEEEMARKKAQILAEIFAIEE